MLMDTEPVKMLASFCCNHAMSVQCLHAYVSRQHWTNPNQKKELVNKLSTTKKYNKNIFKRATHPLPA